MKLYLDILKPTNINKELLKIYNNKTKIKTLVLSQQGIIQIDNIDLTLLQVTDKPIETISINNLRGFIDKSVYTKNIKTYQIPKDHIFEEFNIITYDIRPNALIQLIIEENKNEIKDIYFILKENIQPLDVKNDILTFLSTLKLC